MPASFSTLPLSARTSAVTSPMALKIPFYAAHSPSSARFDSSGFSMSRLVPEAIRQAVLFSALTSTTVNVFLSLEL
jgi:hypothetical protein